MNMTELQTNCPECRSSLVDDIHSGEKICSGCGLVAMEQMSDYGPESRINESRRKNENCKSNRSDNLCTT